MRSWLTLGAVCLLGCSNGGGGGGDMGGSGMVVAMQTVGAGGGTVTVSDPSSPIAGASVTIPPGALPGDTLITISQVTGVYPDDVLDVDFGPSGTTFAVPVTVTVPYSAQYLTDHAITDLSKLFLVTISAEGARQTSRATVDAGKQAGTAQVSHFSNFAMLGATTASLDGHYTLLQYNQFSNTPQGNTPNAGIPLPPARGFSAVLGDVFFNGAGGIVVNSLSGDVDGTPTSPMIMGGNYDVPSSEGLLHIDILKGALLADGSFAALVSTTKDPTIALLLSQKGTFTPGMLKGDYALVQYSYEASVAQPNTPSAGMPLPSPLGFKNIFGNVTFDGNGGFVIGPQTGNQDGVSTMPTANPGTYTVDGVTGRVTIGQLSGQMLSGGRLLAMVSTSGQPTLVVLVRKAKVPVVGSLFGGYFIPQYIHYASIGAGNTPAAGMPLPAPRGFATSWGVVSFDGMGNGTVGMLDGNQDGMPHQNTGQPQAYGFNPDGELIVGTMLLGGASEDGNLFVLGQTSKDPLIVLGVLY